MRLGVTETARNYEQTEVDGVKVFYQAAVKSIFKKMTVKVEKVLIFKTLVAVGEK
ncbi:hypothetical protein SpAn4DRAFT_2804 [Sporomusa ovata]|uniref:Uncharacterized protein n=1 Tax=Sporomusa ovata TaxID=2378 RepID=A0A0U1L092_9FIRM|nr:hypothetical protein [Sporomusa ovata]CQR72344.1 hypothetical protein SpAn4DRAFT_2804 [Sporomusa ovata]